MKNAIIKTLAVSAAALLATGCVSTSDVQRARRLDRCRHQGCRSRTPLPPRLLPPTPRRQRLERLRAPPAAAQSTANQALQAAQGAQACCDATNEKIDRAFKKSMGK